MKISMRSWVWIAVISLIVVVGIPAAASFFYRSLEKHNSLPATGLGEKVWWRAQLFSRKATGRVPDLSWSELWFMTRHQGGFGLEHLATGVSVDGSVRDEYTSEADYRAGAKIFGQKCEMCHGYNGVGANGPALNHVGFKRGDSDLAIYKVIRDGIPGTGMVPPPTSPAERWQLVSFLRLLMVHGTGMGSRESSGLNINVTSDQIRSAGNGPAEWLTYSGSLDGRRYTPLKEITAANVSQLRVRWVQQFDTSDSTVEATPLVASGTIFTTAPPSNVVAFDAKTGKVVWRYDRKVASDLSLCCGRVNRGLAILGHTLYLGALDGYLVALDANTGKVLWETQVADASAGYSMTGAPLIVNQSVVVGMAGGDYGLRGFLAAFDAQTGKQQWKFDTIPGPGEPGHESWKDGWKTGGGSTWATGSYDPALDLIYWGVGNPAPDYSGASRLGDNLFTNSVIALHGSTGKLAWYFQFTPHDEHDWDAAQTPVLTDVSIHGVNRKVICWANRNGFYYVLDRVTGEFLAGAQFADQNWTKGLDLKGRPIPLDTGEASAAGRITKPRARGATNWQNPAFDPSRGLLFVQVTEAASVFTRDMSTSPRWQSRQLFLASAGTDTEPRTMVVRALDAATGAKRWEHFSPTPNKDTPYSYSGLLATGGGLVFGASDGYEFALDANTGAEKWRIFLGGDTRAAPISFTIDGKQVIALSAGRSFFVFGL